MDDSRCQVFFRAKKEHPARTGVRLPNLQTRLRYEMLAGKVRVLPGDKRQKSGRALD
jgi:hypothetical protein